MTPKIRIGSGKAGLLTRSLCTPSRPAGQWPKSAQSTTELTATGIVPDSHRCSLLIPGRQPPAENLARNKSRKYPSHKTTERPDFNQQFVDKKRESSPQRPRPEKRPLPPGQKQRGPRFFSRTPHIMHPLPPTLRHTTRMTPSDSTEINAHSTTPSTSGLTPTVRMTPSESPPPIRKSVAESPACDSHAMARVSIGGNSK